MTAIPTSAPVGVAPDADPSWRTQELLLMSEVMRLVGRSLAPEQVLREMLHLLSELLGLNRGRIVMAEGDEPPGRAARRPSREAPSEPSSIRWAYGLTRDEMARGRYAAGEGITGAVLATGQPILVRDIDAEPRFLCRAVPRERLPPETVAFLAVPIEVNRRTAGVLACHRIGSRHRPLADDVALLKMLATLAGQLLQLAALVAERTRELEAHKALLQGALRSAAARDEIIGSSPALLRALGELHPGAPPEAAEGAAPLLVREYRPLHSHSAEQLREALRRHGGNQSRAAQSLGLTLRQFSYRWRRLGDPAGGR